MSGWRHIGDVVAPILVSVAAQMSLDKLTTARRVCRDRLTPALADAIDDAEASLERLRDIARARGM